MRSSVCRYRKQNAIASSSTSYFSIVDQAKSMIWLWKWRENKTLIDIILIKDAINKSFHSTSNYVYKLKVQSLTHIRFLHPLSPLIGPPPSPLEVSSVPAVSRPLYTPAAWRTCTPRRTPHGPSSWSHKGSEGTLYLRNLHNLAPPGTQHHLITCNTATQHYLINNTSQLNSITWNTTQCNSINNNTTQFMFRVRKRWCVSLCVCCMCEAPQTLPCVIIITITITIIIIIIKGWLITESADKELKIHNIEKYTN